MEDNTYEDLYEIEDATDGEVQSVVRAILAETALVDGRNIKVQVLKAVGDDTSPSVLLSGVVGTEQEFRIAERAVSDRLGIEVHNDLMVNALFRTQQSEDAEVAEEEEREESGLLFGDIPDHETDTAWPIHRVSGADTISFDYGLSPADDFLEIPTVDEAIEGGLPWSPPVGPTPEGLGG